MDPKPQQPAAQRMHGHMNVAGLQFEVVDFPPDMFPDGAILLSQHPTKFEIVDRLRVPRGALVAILHPEQSERLRGEIRRQADAAARKAANDAKPV